MIQRSKQVRSCNNYSHIFVTFGVRGYQIIFKGSITRNSQQDLSNYKARSEKRKIYDALAVGSILHNSSGISNKQSWEWDFSERFMYQLFGGEILWPSLASQRMMKSVLVWLRIDTTSSPCVLENSEIYHAPPWQ